MRVKITVLSVCVALSVPLSAAAKPPVTGGCQVLAPAIVNPDIPFGVTVARAPSYPGQWFAPEISVQITVPVEAGVTPGPNSYSQTVTQTVDGLGGSNSAEATFVVPSVTNLIFGDEVKVTATVSEPLNKNKDVETATCETVTLVN